MGRPSKAARIAAQGCILRTVVGSQVHGVVRAGTDDRDEMAITIEPPEYAIGLHRFEHWAYRTQPDGVPSGPGDLDLIVYSLRKYCQLALKGSPTVLLPLFAPEEQTLVCTDIGRELREHAELFVGPRSRDSFLGYLKAQRSGLVDKGASRGQPRERELSPKHGYGTKYAMHAVRIGYQGLELLENGHITLPIPEPERSHLLEVRLGETPLEDVLTELDNLIRALERAPIPATNPSNELIIERWLIEAYRRHWDETWRPAGLE
jgi:hypothetical protein